MYYLMVNGWSIVMTVINVMGRDFQGIFLLGILMGNSIVFLDVQSGKQNQYGERNNGIMTGKLLTLVAE